MNKEDIIKFIDGIPFYRYEYTYFLYQKLEEKDKEIERLKNDKKKVLELIENDYFEDGSFENYYEVLNILKEGK